MAFGSLSTGRAQSASPSPSTPADQSQEKGTPAPVSPSEPLAAEATPVPPAAPATNSTPQPAQTGAVPAATATPNKTPIDPATAKALDDQFQEALKIHHLRPKKLLALSLSDAVRIALVQNSDVRLAGEDVQSARGALKQATGAFDSKVSVGLGYQRAYLSSGSTGANQAQFSQTFETALASVLRAVQANPNADLNTVISNGFTSAQGQGSEIAIDSYNANASLQKKLRNGISATLAYSPAPEPGAIFFGVDFDLYGQGSGRAFR